MFQRRRGTAAVVQQPEQHGAEADEERDVGVDHRWMPMDGSTCNAQRMPRAAATAWARVGVLGAASGPAFG